MTESGPSRAPRGAALLEPETPSPFLHDRGESVYNPVTGASLARDGEAWRALQRVTAGGGAGPEDPAVLEHLRAARFLIDDVAAEARRTHLLFLSLETCTSCNHRCPFCPVSVDPREREVMSRELFESIVDQVVAAGGQGVVVFLSNYNEPTVDPLFEERCAFCSSRGLPVSILTNASHFTPDRAERLEALGRFRYVGINLPTLDPGALPHAPRDEGPRPRARERRRDARPHARRGDGDRRPRGRGRAAPPRRRGDPGPLRAEGLGGPAVQDPQPAGERHVRPRTAGRRSACGAAS